MTAPPDLGTGRPGVIREVENGIVVPIPSNIDTVQPLNTGVLTADYALITESKTWRGGRELTFEPRVPAPGEITRRPGRMMFCGLMYRHFGHFLVESTARLWAFEQLEDQIDGLVFVPKMQRMIDHVQNMYTPFLKLLGIDTPIYNIPDPVQYDSVLVPQQGFGMFGMIEGLPEYRDFMRRRMGQKIASNGVRRLYISRSELPRKRGGLFGEFLIEQHLKAEGYTIFHPQLHDFETQLAAYKSADYIVSADGSPLHMAALVVKPGTKIAVIARRPDVAAQFEIQFRAFCDIETVTIDALKCHWIPSNNALPNRLSYGELDLADVYRQLRAGGLIASGTTWPDITDQQRGDIMSVLEDRQKIGFKLFEPKP